MLEVAFSLRICCSLVARVRTKALLPSMSFVSPIILPGILRVKSFLATITPACGPPKATGLPKDCISNTAISKPSSPAGLNIPKLLDSIVSIIGTASFSFAVIAISLAFLSTTPKKFGDCTTTAKVSAVRCFFTSSLLRQPVILSISASTKFIPKGRR